MIIFEAIDAAHGDAILVRYKGNAGFERIILVDGGPKSASNEHGKAYVPYETRVIPRLMEIKKERDKKKTTEDIRAGQPELALDLVVCTHIDDDHIAGIERFYGCLSGNGKCAKDGDKVEGKRLWFNSFSALLGDAVDIAAAKLAEARDAVVVSVNQGENLTISGGTDLAITSSCDRGRSPEGFPCSSARSPVPCQARPMSALVKSNLSVPNCRCQRLVAVAAHKVVRAKPAVAHQTAQPTCPRRSGIR